MACGTIRVIRFPTLDSEDTRVRTNSTSHRQFAGMLVGVLACGVCCCPASAASPAKIRIEVNQQRPEVTCLSWDTEGGSRVETNLLRAPHALRLRMRSADPSKTGDGITLRSVDAKPGVTIYRLAAPDAELSWSIAPAPDSISMQISRKSDAKNADAVVELIIPFDPRVTPTTVLPSVWNEDGTLSLPAVINAPDFGQMLFVETGGQRLKARLEGSRAEKIVDLIVELPLTKANQAYSLKLSPILLPAPEGLADKAMWEMARRGWIGIFQPSAKWGDQSRPFSSPAGLLGNNVISDPASCSLWFYADQSLWTPQLTPDISVAALVRRTIDFWLDQRTRPTGEVICYWDYGNFLDANAGPIIASWDYFEATGDREWLARRIERLEFIAEFLAKRDVDNDGMIEATQSGNRGTLKQPGRSCAWFDALNCGHKDGYTNAIIYRAFRGLAELEARLGRADKHARYSGLADRLKASYAKTLFNANTGWLAWWKSEDGELHDYATPIVNGMAIEYGLVPPDQGREILARLWAKIDEVGFKRFDLGVPPMLVPVHRSDYLLPDGLGIAQREDGTDTFGQYQNGGITAGQVLHFMAAHYVVGQPEKADKVLRAMLERQSQGKFQNGVCDTGGQGIDWTDWNGKASGYEGFLADSFRFLQAVLLREPAFRARYYRPMTADAIKP